MDGRNRRLAFAATAASFIAVAGALGSGVAGPRLARADDSSQITFSSEPMQSSVVAHYTVTPAMRGDTGGGSTSAGGGANDDNMADLDFGGSDAQPAAPAQGGGSGLDPSSSGRSTPRTTASFIGLQGSNITCPYFPHGCNPPDMALAASPDFVFHGANSSFEVLSPSGQVQPGWPVNSQVFFGVPNEPNNCDPGSGNQPFMSDPRAAYDTADQRFWAAMLQIDGAPGFGIAPTCPFKSVYFIAVSQTSDPRGNWNVYEFDMANGTNFGADYTQLGVNRDAVFFSGNMFDRSRGFFGYAEVFEANKHQMERGEAGFTPDGFFNLQGNGPGVAIVGRPFRADTAQPMLDISGGDQGQDEGSGAGRAGWFVDTVDRFDLINGNRCSSAADACKGLILWKMSDPVAHDSGGPAPTFSGTYLPNTKSFYAAPAQPHQRSGADQPSCNLCVDANDLRIPATPVLKNGTIYTGWGTGVFNGTQVVPGIVWAQIRLGEGRDGPSTMTNYFNFTGDDAATYPALMPDSQGKVVMLYEHMGHTTFPEARYTVKENDASTFGSAGRVLKAGEANYRPGVCGTAAVPVCRWGDFEATSFDGNGRVWIAGEYANSNTDPSQAPAFGRNWGCFIGALGSSED